ncbi:MAG: putative C-S lyase [Spirochaetales bacterium]|nr:putative C-S lyase [Spirochaetales bacterium]
MAEHAIETPESPFRRGTNSVKWDLSSDPESLPLWVADMDFACPREIVDAMSKRLEHPIFGYTFAPESFFEAFRTWAQVYQSWNFPREHQLYALGMMPAIRESLYALTSPGDGVIVQPPVYNPFYTVVENAGRRVVRNPLLREGNRYSMNFAELEELVRNSQTTLLLLCSPHNPVGRVWTQTELRRVVELCDRYGVKVLVDEIHGDLILPGEDFYALGRLGADNTVTIQSPGKTFNIPSLNTAQVITQNSEIRSRLSDFFDRAGFEIANSMSLVASEAGYRYGRPWLDGVLAQIQKNTELFDTLIRGAGLPLMRIPAQGTYLAWVQAKPMQESLNLSTRDLQRRIRKDTGVWISPGSQFDKSEGEGFLRFNLATSEENLREAIVRIRRWWEDHEG